MKPKTADQHNREAGVSPTTFTPTEKRSSTRGKIQGKIVLPKQNPNDGWYKLSQPIPIQDFNDKRGRIIMLDDGRMYLIGDLSFAALSTMRVNVVAYTDAYVPDLVLIEKRYHESVKGS